MLFSCLLALLIPHAHASVPLLKSPLFAARAPLSFSLKSAFQKVKRENGEGNWRDDDRSDPRFWSEMELTDLANPEIIFKGRLRARGMSSSIEGEGDFPKLKVEIGKSQERGGTLFEKDREFRVNTHVTTHPRSSHTEMGRLNDERSPYREALAYDWSEALGFPSFATRRAEISYEETESREKFTRKALLLEKDKSFGERHGAKVVSIIDFAASQDTKISLADSAKFHFFQALIGNKDFILRTSREPRREDNPIWGCGNCVVLETADGHREVAPYDFDLSTFVAGEIKIKGSWNLYPEFGFRDEATSFLAWSISSLRARHPEADVRMAWADLKSKAEALHAATQDSLIDEEGQKIALRHEQRFFSLVPALLELPVIAAPGKPFLSKPRGGKSLLRAMPDGRRAYLRPGTPVKVLQVGQGWKKIAVLDFKWDLADSEKRVGYVPSDTLIMSWTPEEYLAFQDARDAPKPDSRRDGK
jgi:hypothetical protein